MMFYSSMCAMIMSAILYRMPRKNWPIFVDKFVLEIEYSLLGIREVFLDWIYARQNRIGNTLHTGKVAIVTGGARGIGLKIVKMLMERDVEVIIACRNEAAGYKAIREIRESGVTKGQAKVYKLDNKSLASVKHFAEEIKKDYNEIHVLINNAGVMYCDYEETEDGFEQQWAVNYLSHFLLTALLLPLLKSGGLPGQCSRVVNVTSCAHLMKTINFDDTNLKSRFLTGVAYAQSKLAQVVFTKKLQNLLKEKELNVQMYSVHPGIVQTDIFVKSFVSRLKWISKYFFKTPEQGAIPVVYTALEKALEMDGGAYITNCRNSKVNKDALDPLIQRRLLEISLRQVQLKDFFQFV